MGRIFSPRISDGPDILSRPPDIRWSGLSQPAVRQQVGHQKKLQPFQTTTTHDDRKPPSTTNALPTRTKQYNLQGVTLLHSSPRLQFQVPCIPSPSHRAQTACPVCSLKQFGSWLQPQCLWHMGLPQLCGSRANCWLVPSTCRSVGELVAATTLPAS